MKLLSVNADAKTIKGVKKGYLTGILYLAPANLSGFEVCPMRTQGCTAACLGWNAGRVNIIKKGETTNTIRDSRIAKTRWYFEDRQAFLAQLVKEIEALVRKAEREGLKPAVRLNGSSDIPWERVVYQQENATIMGLFPDVQFYDYTKVTKRALASARGQLPVNYTLTYSATGENDSACLGVLEEGGTVAMVFDTVPSEYWSYDVIDGDETDLRFDDGAGVIVGLKAKGEARKDTSGFVRRIAA